MRLIILIISILFSAVCSGQRLPPHTTTVNIGDTETPVQVIDDSSFYRNTTVKPKVEDKVLTIKDVQLITNHIREKVKDKVTVSEWDKVVEYINRIVMQRQKELEKPK